MLKQRLAAVLDNAYSLNGQDAYASMAIAFSVRRTDFGLHDNRRLENR